MSCTGHVDGIKKWIDNNSSITHYNQPEFFRQKVTWSCATADIKHLVVKVTHSVPGSFSFIICAILISVNAF